MRWLFFAFLPLWLYAGLPTILDETGRIKADLKLLRMYDDFNEGLLRDHDIDFRTVITDDEEDINLFANRMFKELQRESRSRSGRALLFVINRKQDLVRLEVSAALEGVYTDAFVSYIEREGIVPFLRRNDIAGAIYRATELVSDRAIDATKRGGLGRSGKSASYGAGAKTRANIGQRNATADGADITVSAGETPKEVIEKYLAALREGNRRADLQIFSKASREFFAKRPITKISQKNEIRFLAPCIDEARTFYAPDGIHAVIRNARPVRNRTCSPYFFIKEKGLWRIDFMTMANVLRFNQKMMWHFDLNRRLEGEGKYYAFAFDGYTIGKNGYIHYPKGKKKPVNARWGFQCGQWHFPKDSPGIENHPEKIRCGLLRVYQGSPAEVRLGLEPWDYIYGVGEGSDFIPYANYRQFMEYMKNVPSGEVATVHVRHNHGPLVIKQGIAP